jgi:hypothetical protein
MKATLPVYGATGGSALGFGGVGSTCHATSRSLNWVSTNVGHSPEQNTKSKV